MLDNMPYLIIHQMNIVFDGFHDKNKRILTLEYREVGLTP